MEPGLGNKYYVEQSGIVRKKTNCKIHIMHINRVLNSKYNMDLVYIKALGGLKLYDEGL